jgi:hypothetical protein
MVISHNGKTGLGKIILALRGSSSKTLHKMTKDDPLFGAGKNKPETWWKGLGK